MTAKEYLKQAYFLNMQIDTLQKQVDYLRNKLNSISSPILSKDKVQSSTDPDKVANLIAKVIDLEVDINNRIDKYIDLKTEIIRKIENVHRDEYRILLQKRYLNYETWERIAYDMNYARRWVLTLHDRALKYFSSRNRWE